MNRFERRDAGRACTPSYRHAAEVEPSVDPPRERFDEIMSTLTFALAWSMLRVGLAIASPAAMGEEACWAVACSIGIATVLVWRLVRSRSE